MKKQTKKTAVYEVLIPCSDDDGAYEVGDTVTDKTFSRTVILNWLSIAPPVLKLKDGE